MLDKDDTVIEGRLLDTHNRRGSSYRFYSSSGSDRYHGHHSYHPYRRSDKGFFPDEFKKAKPPNFNGNLKKSEDAEAWFLGMNKFFELHDYIENMKSMIFIFNLKWKENI